MPFALEQLSQALTVPTNPSHAQAQTATFNGPAVDMQKFQRVMFLVDVGTVSGTSPTLDIKLQDSADNTTFADVSPAVTATQITAASKTITVEARADQYRRYVRLVFTIGGTTPSFTMAVIPMASEAQYKPAAKNYDAAQVTQRLVA